MSKNHVMHITLRQFDRELHFGLVRLQAERTLEYGKKDTLEALFNLVMQAGLKQLQKA